ncbi:hypothetical protein DSM14862_00390 [Sulfitobacter indolifex]|uniref:DUF2125 domain-containing protein n=1 Tax=Sulfitobacter indolifex HEL-45 TaxID=391624 RepID=A0ABM9XBB2_9RHOB|nr:hypothetical protein [Sulfitobacter indolifex]EDQ06650.1 hypothetical protein OIHEL45_07530 [Sulfitobacter indolifex HEL-45]UOA17639.1 hypothetical protein DSM14862_00390 [Sulfitobacter indolifex]
MSRIPTASLFLALPVSLASTALWADLTPAEVWGDWRQYMESMGYQVQASEAFDGEDLTVSDVTLKMDMIEEGGDFSMSLGTLSFEPESDGAVNVRMPNVMPMTINVAPETPEDEPVSMVLNYAQTAPVMRASGSPDALQYDYAADTISLTLAGLKVGAQSYTEEEAKFSVTGSGVSSRTEMTGTETRRYDQSGRIDSLQYDVVMKTPDDPARVAVKGGVDQVVFNGSGALPMLEAGSDMAAMMRAGLTFDGSFTAGAGRTDMQVSDPENGDFQLVTGSAGAKLGVAMGPEGMVYEGGQQDIEVSVTAADMPFPIQFSMAESAFNLKMPLMKSEEPQDFAFGVTLDSFKMSDMIWGIFDPTGQLPRDPATLVVDLSGKAKLLFELMDPEVTATMGDEVPGEIHELNVNEVSLDVAGAEFDATGAITFDNNDLETVPGMPKPVGALDLSLIGGVALLDKLVTMGLIPQEQALGARMMMGLFTVPGEGEDSLTSRIEFTEEGGILANGQQIK